MNAEPRNRDFVRRFTHPLLILLLLSIFAFQCIFSMIRMSATSDEVAHLPAGYSYLKTGDFRLNPEHPPLIKIISAYPLLLLALPSPETDRYFLENQEWEYGRSLIYGSGTKAETILFSGRMVIVLLGLLLGILIYSWTNELFGRNGALFSLFLFAFEPDLIAHSSLVTTDLGFSLFFLLFIFWMWNYFRKSTSNFNRSGIQNNRNRSGIMPDLWMLIICGLSAGLAFSTKYSAVLLIPISAVLIAYEAYVSLMSRKSYTSNRNRSGIMPDLLRLQSSKTSGRMPDLLQLQSSLLRLLLFICVVPVIAFIVVAACYGFINLRYYLLGLRSVAAHSAVGHAAFCAGQYSDTGWWYYFPLAIILKTPVPLMLFFLISIILIVLLLKRASKTSPENHETADFETGGKAFQWSAFRWRNLTYLFFPPLFFLAASIAGRLNIGLRHVLPVFPFAIIICGAIIAGMKGRGSRLRMPLFILFAALLLWYAAGSFLIFPHYLSYFNELTGGSSNGYKYFVDSNLDWGQNMPALKEYLEKNAIDGVIFSYFGNADPYYYGIDYQYLPLCGKPKIPSNYRPPEKEFGFIAISATNLQAVFTPDHHCFDWLKNRKPYARVAYSIFIYDIRGDADAHERLAKIYAGAGMKEEAEKHTLMADRLKKDR